MRRMSATLVYRLGWVAVDQSGSGAVAQLGERYVRNVEVGSSILLRSTWKNRFLGDDGRRLSGMSFVRRFAKGCVFYEYIQKPLPLAACLLLAPDSEIIPGLCQSIW